jgi:hypothetical protein
MRKEARISEKQVLEAIQRFQARGGLIKKLPPETIPPPLLVGARHGRFEPLNYYLRSDGLTG